MSASDEWTEWHLTPRGWEKGDWQVDFGGRKEGPTPDDRVLTAEYSEYMSSVYSKMNTGTKILWRGPDEDLIKRLLEQYGDPPNRL